MKNLKKTLEKIVASIMSIFTATTTLNAVAMTAEPVEPTDNTDNEIKQENTEMPKTITDDENIEFDESAQPVSEYSAEEVNSDVITGTYEVSTSTKEHTDNTTYETENRYYIIGDANEDDKLNIHDAACIAKRVANRTSDELAVSADYTQDGNVNIRDAASIARYCASNDTSVMTMPVEQPVAETTTTTTVADTTSDTSETTTSVTTVAETTHRVTGSWYVAHYRPVPYCTCVIDENTELCSRCGTPMNCRCGQSSNPVVPMVTVELTPVETTETTTTVVTTEMTETEATDTTATTTEAVETTVTDMTSIATETTVADTTDTTAETTTVATTEQTADTTETTVATTTVVTKTTMPTTTVASMDKYLIEYVVNPIYEEHLVERTSSNRGEYCNGETSYEDYENNGGTWDYIDLTVMYYDYLKETDLENNAETYSDWYRNVYCNWFYDKYDRHSINQYTQQTLIGYKYTFSFATTNKEKPMKLSDWVTREELSNVLGFEVPETFTSILCYDANTNAIRNMQDELLGIGDYSTPNPNTQNVLEYYKTFINSPVIYYNDTAHF